jgi:hypothetical protein
VIVKLRRSHTLTPFLWVVTTPGERQIYAVETGVDDVQAAKPACFAAKDLEDTSCSQSQVSCHDADHVTLAHHGDSFDREVRD